MRKRDVINMAMDLLDIGAIDDADNNRLSETKKANRWYTVSASYVITFTDWIDAIASTTFTSEAAITNIWDDIFSYVYELPSDSLRIIDVDLDKGAPWIVEGNYLHTNYYDSSTGFTVRYIKDIRAESSTLTQYSDLLGGVIANRLAYDMGPLASKPLLKAIFEDILYEAVQVNHTSEMWPKGNKNPYFTDVDSIRTRRRRGLGW